jgi:hypothetical protein
MRVFFQKAAEVFQVSEPPGHCERTPDPLANGLLHRFSFDFHRPNLNALAACRQLAN